jgi:hypothetical protein
MLIWLPARSTVLEGLKIRSVAQEVLGHFWNPKVQYRVHKSLSLDHILPCSQEPATGTYPAVFTRACHWTLSCHVHKSLSLDYILPWSQEPATGPYPAVFTRACHWTLSCHVHKSLPLDHILPCSQQPATGLYPAVFTTACHWTLSCHVHKSLPLDHILPCSQEPATGPYPAVFTRSCQEFQHFLWSVNCNYLIQEIIGLHLYWFTDKILIRLAGGGAPVAVKRRTVNQSSNARTFLYILTHVNCYTLVHSYTYNPWGLYVTKTYYLNQSGIVCRGSLLSVFSFLQPFRGLYPGYVCIQ